MSSVLLKALNTCPLSQALTRAGAGPGAQQAAAAAPLEGSYSANKGDLDDVRLMGAHAAPQAGDEEEEAAAAAEAPDLAAHQQERLRDLVRASWSLPPDSLQPLCAVA